MCFLTLITAGTKQECIVSTRGSYTFFDVKRTHRSFCSIRFLFLGLACGSHGGCWLWVVELDGLKMQRVIESAGLRRIYQTQSSQRMRSVHSYNFRRTACWLLEIAECSSMALRTRDDAKCLLDVSCGHCDVPMAATIAVTVFTLSH
jgi:hypothetical protein